MDDVRAFASASDWEDWLEREHESSPGLWLQIAKKGSQAPTLSYQQALEVALCFGWIDGQKKPLDGAFWLQRFTPRKSGSRWSQINRVKATELMAQGKMRPAGVRQVAQAQADGRWDAAYASPRNATVPDDLQAALDAEPEARRFFETLDSANRYAVLYRVQDAKKPETRAQRIAKFVAMLRRGEKLHP